MAQTDKAPQCACTECNRRERSRQIASAVGLLLDLTLHGPCWTLPCTIHIIVTQLSDDCRDCCLLCYCCHLSMLQKCIWHAHWFTHTMGRALRQPKTIWKVNRNGGQNVTRVETRHIFAAIPLLLPILLANPLIKLNNICIVLTILHQTLQSVWNSCLLQRWSMFCHVVRIDVPEFCWLVSAIVNEHLGDSKSVLPIVPVSHSVLLTIPVVPEQIWHTCF